MRELVSQYCWDCDDDRLFSLVRTTESINIRGERVTTVIPYVECAKCNARQVHPDVDLMELFYQEARNRGINVGAV
jgi:hypothetical protein